MAGSRHIPTPHVTMEFIWKTSTNFFLQVHNYNTHKESCDYNLTSQPDGLDRMTEERKPKQILQYKLPGRRH
jgi:hypothetical protein